MTMHARFYPAPTSYEADLKRHYGAIRRRIYDAAPAPVLLPPPPSTNKTRVRLAEDVGSSHMDVRRAFFAQLSGWPGPARRIAGQVCGDYGVAIADIMSTPRTGRISKARHCLMYRLRAETSASLSQIGRMIGGRDHTTVLHGVRTHAARHDLSEPVREIAHDSTAMLDFLRKGRGVWLESTMFGQASETANAVRKRLSPKEVLVLRSGFYRLERRR